MWLSFKNLLKVIVYYDSGEGDDEKEKQRDRESKTIKMRTRLKYVYFRDLMNGPRGPMAASLHI